MLINETSLASLCNDFVSICTIKTQFPVVKERCSVTVLSKPDTDLMYLSGEVNGTPFTFTVDTGCGGVVINRSFISLLKLRPQVSSMRLEFADSSLSDPVLEDTVDITLTDEFGITKTIPTPVYFADIPAHEVILGLPWMRKHVKFLCPAEEGVSHDSLIWRTSVPGRIPAFVCGCQESPNAPIRSDPVAAGVSSVALQPTAWCPSEDIGGKDLQPEPAAYLHSEIGDMSKRRDVTDLDNGCNTQAVAPSPSQYGTRKAQGVDTVHTPCEWDTPAVLRVHHIDVLSTKVVRWHVRKRKALERKPTFAIKLMTVKTVNKAAKDARTSMFLATAHFLPHEQGGDKDTLDFADIHEKENPIEDICDNPRTMEERIKEKVQSIAPEWRGKFEGILRNKQRLLPSELPHVDQSRSTIRHPIKLVEGARPKKAPIYHCSELELEQMKEQITTLLKAGHIRHSMSPWAAPVLFVKKKNTAKLRMCIDFRHLNKNTIKDATPIARMDELRQRLVGAKRFTALDLMSGYHQIQIEESDIPYTAFNCRYGHFEWRVMPFGLTNAPATFCRWINEILGPFLDVCVIAYLDDILIYSKNSEDHVKHVEQVLTALEQAGAVLNLEKSHFHKTKVEFLGHNVDEHGITPNTSYVEAISKWPAIRNKGDVASFCGLINYFKNWIPQYADLLRPLNLLRKKDVPFIWTPECDESVKQIQIALTSAPILEYFDKDKETIITVDASAYAVGGWLGQRPANDKEATIKPVLYWSRKMKDAETRYGTHERELLGLVEMLRVTRPYIEGRRFTVRTDHKALEYLQDQSTLSRRQAGWVEKIQAHDMWIEYLPGEFNCVADALSRRPDYYPNCPRCNAQTEAVKKGPQLPVTMIRLKGQSSLPLYMTRVSIQQPLMDTIRKGYSAAELAKVRELIKQPADNFQPSWKIYQGIVYTGSRIFVPEALRQKIMYTVHDVNTVHSGTKKTIDLLARSYYWPSMGKDVKKWIRCCDECQRKLKNKQSGPLTSLEIPQARFLSFAMDFADAPNANADGYDQVLIVIERLRKHVTLIPAKSADTAENTARRFAEYVVRFQGVPQEIVADRDPLWTSKFWAAFTKNFNIEMQLTTARHQNANGLAEAAVKSFKNMMTVMLNRPETKDWVEALPYLQLAYNNTPQTSTGFSPNELTFGCNMNIELTSTPTNVESVDTLTRRIAALVKETQQNLRAAQERQAHEYNKHRDTEASLEVGEEALLSTAGLNLQTSVKYTHRFLGPFKVLKKLPNNNYRLALPSCVRIHPVFHISKLHKYVAPDKESFQAAFQRPPPVEVVGEEVDQPTRYAIDRIVNSRFRKVGKSLVKEYLCKWSGYDNSSNTWQSKGILLEDAPQLVEKYEQQASKKTKKGRSKK
jgi:hypothetical protein